MIYRQRKHKSNYSIGLTKGRQFVKIELGTRVWYFHWGISHFWTLIHINNPLTEYGDYTTVTHLNRKHRVTVDRLKDIPSFKDVVKLVNQAYR